jgi:hypothetical protein
MSKYKRRLHIPIYERVLIIIITECVDDEVKKIMNEHEEDPSEASVIVNDKGEIILVIRPDANINTICHECFHITYEIASGAGMKLSRKSEEGYSYLIGYVAELIDNELKRYHK